MTGMKRDAGIVTGVDLKLVRDPLACQYEWLLRGDVEVRLKANILLKNHRGET